jgi:plasmid replication initiation protein
VERYVRVTGGEKGIATIWDNDLLIYARTLLAGKLNRGEPTSNRIAFSVHDFLVATGRDTGLKAYQAFREMVMRLQTTTVFTNIAAGEYVEDSGFGWLQSFRMRKAKRGNREMLAACEIVLCDWVYQAALAQRFLTVDRSYFDLTSALERKLWLIIRRHLGRQPMWFVGLDTLQERCASQQDARKFRHEIKKIVDRDPFPEFKLSMTNDPRALMRMTPSAPGKPGRSLYLVCHQRRSAIA